MKKTMMTLALLMAMGSYAEARMTLEDAKAVCNKGNADMCLSLGKKMQKKKMKEAQEYYDKGIRIVKKKCANNSADACFSMARLQAFGLGMKKDTKKAIASWEKSKSLFEKSCKKGDEKSCGKVEHCDAMIEMAKSE